MLWIILKSERGQLGRCLFLIFCFDGVKGACIFGGEIHFTSFQVFGRTVSIAATRSRWFDVPLTREESLQADKRIVITFGPSADPSNVTIVDSVKM